MILQGIGKVISLLGEIEKVLNRSLHKLKYILTVWTSHFYNEKNISLHKTEVNGMIKFESGSSNLHRVKDIHICPDDPPEKLVDDIKEYMDIVGVSQN